MAAAEPQYPVPLLLSPEPAKGLDPAAGGRPFRHSDPGGGRSPCGHPSVTRELARGVVPRNPGRSSSVARPGDDRDVAVNVHQLRASHWGRAESYLHRIGRRPTLACAGCSERDCPASRCIVCRKETNSPGHILLRCPSLAGTRPRLLGAIHPPPEAMRDADAVAVLTAAFAHLELLQDDPERGHSPGYLLLSETHSTAHLPPRDIVRRLAK